MEAVCWCVLVYGMFFADISPFFPNSSFVHWGGISLLISVVTIILSTVKLIKVTSFHSTVSCFAFLCMIFWLFLHSLWTVASLPISFKDHKPRATSEEQFHYTDDPETVNQQIGQEDTPQDDSSSIQHNGNGGKPGFISFYNPRNKTEDIVLPPEEAQSTWGRLLWLIGPTVLVSSFTLPPIYLRRIVSAVFEDSLLTGSSLCIPLPLLLNLTQTHFHLLFCRLPHIVLHWGSLLLWSRRFSPDNTPFENAIHQNQPYSFSVRTKNLLCSNVSP